MKFNKIIVCSQSDIKLNAVKNVFPGYPVVGYKCESLVGEQPRGTLETKCGMRTRLCYALECNIQPDIFFISIENGIVDGYDIAYIKFHFGHNHFKTYESEKVEIPNMYLPQSDSETWGQCLFNQGKCKDSNDPHLDVCGKSRVDILSKAIEKYFINYFYVFVSHYPFKGIEKFYDINDIIMNPFISRHFTEFIGSNIDISKIDYIAGIDSRGFLFSSLLSIKFNKSSFMVRKANKHPNLITNSIETEYSKDTLGIPNSIDYTNARVLLVDDIVATGGSFIGAKDLLMSQGASIVKCAAVIDLVYIPKKDIDFISMFKL